jgi:hypothetical protein
MSQTELISGLVGEILPHFQAQVGHAGRLFFSGAVFSKLHRARDTPMAIQGRTWDLLSGQLRERLRFPVCFEF